MYAINISRNSLLPFQIPPPTPPQKKRNTKNFQLYRIYKVANVCCPNLFLKPPVALDNDINTACQSSIFAEVFCLMDLK